MKQPSTTSVHIACAEKEVHFASPWSGWCSCDNTAHTHIHDLINSSLVYTVALVRLVPVPVYLVFPVYTVWAR